MPLSGWKVHLRKGAAHPPEQMADGKAQVSRQQFGLIESAPVAPRPVQRHRNSDVGPGEDVGAVMAHQGAKPRGDRLTSAVLERMNDVAQRAVIVADGAGAINGASASRAVRAEGRQTRIVRSTSRTRAPIAFLRVRDAFVGPTSEFVARPCFAPVVSGEPVETPAKRGQGVTAPIAEGRRNRPNHRPATFADRTGSEMLEDGAAGGARWGEQHQRRGFGASSEAVREARPPVRRTGRAWGGVSRCPRADPGCKTGAGRP